MGHSTINLWWDTNLLIASAMAKLNGPNTPAGPSGVASAAVHEVADRHV
jgi:hypothetical protein